MSPLGWGDPAITAAQDPGGANFGPTQAAYSAGKHQSADKDRIDSVPTAIPTRVESKARVLSPETPSGAQNGAAPQRFSPADARLQQLEQKLRQLGAAFYVLEEIEADPVMYHFVAEVVEPSHPNGLRRFEAYAAEPFEAITKVVAQMESQRR
jgi:hypothetical protein